MNYVRAAIVAIILGWGTAGAGLLFAYRSVLSPSSSRTSSKLTACRTPTVGLGATLGHTVSRIEEVRFVADFSGERGVTEVPGLPIIWRS